MKIALVAPFDETVPPLAYGGTELVVHYLARELARRGHDVLLLAAGGSHSAGRLIPLVGGPLRDRHSPRWPSELERQHRAIVKNVIGAIQSESPDLIHSHFRHLVGSESAMPCPMITTIHHDLYASRGRDTFLQHPDSTYVSISMSQRVPAPHLNFVANIHHGVPVEEFPFVANPAGYVAFVGRICPEKGVDLAIDAARDAGAPLRIAAKVDPQNESFFKSVVVPRLDRGKVDFLGELDQREKRQLLGNALALLCPVRWHEPFGLVLIEAMACGTPVIGFERGAIPEIVLDGKSGLLVGDRKEMVTATRDIGAISREQCRTHVVEHFNVARMACDYEDLYRTFL